MEPSIINHRIVTNRLFESPSPPRGFVLWLFNLVDKILSAVGSIFCSFRTSSITIPREIQPVLNQARFNANQFLSKFSESESTKIAEYLNSEGREIQKDVKKFGDNRFISKELDGTPASFQFLFDGTIYIHTPGVKDKEKVESSLWNEKEALRISRNGEIKVMTRLVAHLDQFNKIQAILQKLEIDLLVDWTNESDIPMVTVYMENFKDGSLRSIINKQLSDRHNHRIIFSLI